MPLLGPPWHVPLFGTFGSPPVQRGHGWMPGTPPSLSPVRKMLELSGRTTSVAPVSQAAVPVSGADATLVTQTLVGMVIAFGTASGAPKRQPVPVQFLLLPVAVDVVPPRVAVCPVHDVIALMAKPRSGTAK